MSVPLVPCNPTKCFESEQSPYLTRKQVAVYLGVSEKWLAQGGRSTGPQFYKFGSQCRYLISDVKNWASQQRVAA